MNWFNSIKNKKDIFKYMYKRTKKPKSKSINTINSTNSIKSPNINEHDYILRIINNKFESEELLHKKFDDYTSSIFDTIKNKNPSSLKLPSKKCDCVILGGGLRGYYVFGSLILLKKMIDNKQIKVRKFIGVSAGAFLVVFLLSNLNIELIRNINEFAIKNNNKYAMDHIMIKICWEILPENIHEIINGKVSILVSKKIILSNREKFIDHFDSKMHLLQVLHASSFIPFITSKDFHGVNIKGELYYDGAFSNINPVNYDNDVPQLVFYTNEINYPLSNTFKFNDTIPEIIILKGLIEFEKFIRNIMSGNLSDNLKYPIKWIDHNNHNHNHNNSSKIYSDTSENIIMSTSFDKSTNFKSKTIKSTNFKSKTIKNTNFKSNNLKSSFNKILFILFMSICELICLIIKK